MTRPGVIIGTVPYMSPEQARGRTLDTRSDIFSFGTVLYEMLAGRRPFEGKSDVQVLAAITDVQPHALPPEVPVALRMIVEKALEKEAADRYQSMQELVVDLRRIARRPSETREAVIPPAAPSRSLLTVASLCLAAIASIGLVFCASRGGGTDAARSNNPLGNAHFTRLTDFVGDELDATISPDGKFVAFVSDRDGPFDVWITQIGSGAFRNVTQGTDAWLPRALRSAGFSGDGTQIWLGGDPTSRMQIMPMMASTPRSFLGERVITVSWSPDGKQIAYHTQDDRDPMFVADPDGANAKQIYKNPLPGGHNHFPTWSPDGKWIYFVSGLPATNEMDLWRISPTGGDAERLTTHNGLVSYTAPVGDAVFYVARDADGGGPWLWAFDAQRKSTTRVSLGIERFLSVSANADGSRLVATVANPSARLWQVPILTRVATEEDVTPMQVPTVNATAPRFSGQSLFYFSSSGENALWRYRDGQAVEVWRAATGAGVDPPAISADGRQIALALRRGGKRVVHVLSEDGAELKPLTNAIDARGSSAWSPDGKWIVTGGNGADGPGLFKVPVDGGQPVRLVSGPALDPVWSPDGTWIVYSGRNLSAMAPLLAVGMDGTKIDLPEIKVFRDGQRARFMPDGSGLVFMQGAMVSQDFWMLELPSKRVRPIARLKHQATMRTFDVSPDGKRIVFDRSRDNSDVVLIDLPRREAR